jgi:hypothetical protein
VGKKSIISFRKIYNGARDVLSSRPKKKKKKDIMSGVQFCSSSPTSACLLEVVDKCSAPSTPPPSPGLRAGKVGAPWPSHLHPEVKLTGLSGHQEGLMQPGRAGDTSIRSKRQKGGPRTCKPKVGVTPRQASGVRGEAGRCRAGTLSPSSVHKVEREVPAFVQTVLFF